MRERKEAFEDEDHREEGTKIGKQRSAKEVFRRNVKKMTSVRAFAASAVTFNKGGADSKNAGGVAGGAKRFSGAKTTGPGAKADEVMAAALANTGIPTSPGSGNRRILDDHPRSTPAVRRGLDDPSGAAWNPTRMPAGDGSVTGTWNQSSKGQGNGKGNGSISPGVNT